MSDMGLLMTGVLATGQLLMPNLPENSPVQLDNEIDKSQQSQLSGVVLTNQITSPEFMVLHEDVSITLSTQSAIAPDKQDHQQNIYLQSIAESEYSQVEAENTVAEDLYYSNVHPEFIPISEATTTNDFRVASTSTTEFKSKNNHSLVQTSSYQQPQHIAGGLPQPRRSRSKQPRNYKRVIKVTTVASPVLPMLAFGNTGDAVRVLQRLLSSNGYAVQPDGVFGALTESAVKAFQNRRNLIPDGVVGQRTWRELTK